MVQGNLLIFCMQGGLDCLEEHVIVLRNTDFSTTEQNQENGRNVEAYSL